jgi:hypothetical protein
MPVSDAVRRAVKIAEDALIRLGYEVIHLNINEELYQKTIACFWTLLSNGTIGQLNNDFKQEAEPLSNAIKATNFYFASSNWVKQLIRKATAVAGNPRKASRMVATDFLPEA